MAGVAQPDDERETHSALINICFVTPQYYCYPSDTAVVVVVLHLHLGCCPSRRRLTFSSKSAGGGCLYCHQQEIKRPPGPARTSPNLIV